MHNSLLSSIWGAKLPRKVAFFTWTAAPFQILKVDNIVKMKPCDY